MAIDERFVVAMTRNDMSKMYGLEVKRDLARGKFDKLPLICCN